VAHRFRKEEGDEAADDGRHAEDEHGSRTAEKPDEQSQDGADSFSGGIQCA
jgi:hypothetical protein